MTNKIKYWWSEDRKWFCVRIKGETVSLTVEEAEELMGEVQQTPSFLVLQEEASQRAVELMEQSRENSTTAGSERIDIVERLRFDATRCELQFSKGVAGNINDAADEIESLRRLIPDVAQPERKTTQHALLLAREAICSGHHTLAAISAIDVALAQPPAAPVETDSHQIQYVVEGIILRRLHEKRIEGYTIETAKEIAQAVVARPQCSAGIATEPVVCPTCGGPCKLSFHGAVSVKYDENGRAHHRPGPPVTDELILRVAVAIASRRDAFKSGEKLAQSYLDDAREAVAVFRAVPQPLSVSEEERHAIEHARYQIDQASILYPDCCFDMDLVKDLVRALDRAYPMTRPHGACGK